MSGKPASSTRRTVGYLRVSTEAQDLDKNRADILALANREDLGRVEFVEEKVSGKTPWRKRKIAAVIEDLREGDVLIVSELSRLGRSMLECMEILSIAAARRIRVYAIKGNWRLDDTIQSKIVAMAFSMAAEIERDLISARTTEALRARKASGLPLGRPERTRQKQARPVPPRDRGAPRQRINPGIHRQALRHYPRQPLKLDQKARHHTTQTMKSCGGFGTFVGLDPGMVRNSLISGNDDDATDYGLRFQNVTGGVIEGNIIGLNAAGTAALGNSAQGILLDGTNSGITIGGATAATRNVISGNGDSGIVLDGASTITILGNYVGTDITGNTALANGGAGIIFTSSAISGVTIGGTGAGAGNVISGNAADGIDLFDNTGIDILGNTIGLGANGTTAIPNTGRGIQMFGASAVTIGDGTTAGRNVISGNGTIGINIDGSSSNVDILGNTIGLDVNGVLDRGNTAEGILINGSSAITIGDGTTGGGNVISGNGAEGIRSTGSTSDLTILGNTIGTRASGTSALPNGAAGIRLDGTTTATIGSSAADGGNVISGNTGSGIHINGGSGITIRNNHVGVTASGNIGLGNGFSGISVDSATTVTIGGTGVDEGNVLSDNGNSGLFIYGTSSGVTALGNHIGVGENGSTALGNAHSGVWVANTASAVIGGETSAAANIIANNGNDGVTVVDTASAAIFGNAIEANGDLGIDLANDAVTANDSGDGDSGPNELLNFPVLNGIGADRTVDITYDFNLDVPSHGQGYRIDFFKNTAADASGHGEGEIHLGSVDIAHAGGDLNFAGSLTANAAVSVGDIISATATRKTGASSYDITSEFSANTLAADPLVVTTTADSGAGSLRAAITYANANAAEDDIVFNIPGGGVQTITLTSNIENITDDGISIDGTTQDGAVCGDLWAGTPHTLMIQIDGNGATTHGLQLDASNIAIKGLSITNAGAAVAPRSTSGSVTLTCSYLGLAPDGTADGNDTGVLARGADMTVGGLSAGGGQRDPPRIISPSSRRPGRRTPSSAATSSARTRPA